MTSEYVSKNSCTQSANEIAESTAVGLVGIASFAAGAYHGFCNAKGIPISSENVELALKWGPTLVQGAGLGFIGAVTGAVDGVKTALKGRDSKLEKIVAAFTEAPVRAVIEGVELGLYSGAIAATYGAAESFAGYALGYLAGSIGR